MILRPTVRATRAPAILALLTILALHAPVAAQEASPTPAPQGPPAPSVPTPLEPGRHTWDDLGFGVSVDVGDGWELEPPLDGPIIVLERPETPGGVLTITRFDGDTFADSCDSTSLTEVEPTSDRLIAIIAGNPFLSAKPPEDIDVGGYSGQSLDTMTPPFGPQDCPLPYILLWAIPMQDGEFVQVTGQSSRFIAVDVGQTTVVIAIETLPGVPFEPFALDAMDLVRSMTFDVNGS